MRLSPSRGVTLLRGLAVLALLAGMPLSVAAQKRVTVAQLEKLLSAQPSAKKTDVSLMQQIAGMELTERLSPTKLAGLMTHLDPASGTAVALRLMADQSAFLDPPESEQSALAAPDSDRQRAMLEAARTYVNQAMPRLPDFLATRVIDLYDDRPWAVKPGDWPTRQGLHLTGTSSGEVSVRSERENQPATQASSVWQARIGLVSGGEFGNTLGMIVADTAQGKISWSHWESTTTGAVAVYRYEVPASASHYEVLSTLRREAEVAGMATPDGGSRKIQGIGLRPNVTGANVSIVHTRPGYHGSIWINPADGTVLRITMDADLSRGVPFRRAAILIEYGAVEISGSTFVCPVRSIALSRSMTAGENATGDAPTEWLNETRFVGYHRFASTTRMVADSPGASTPPTAPASIPAPSAVEANGEDAAAPSPQKTASSAAPASAVPGENTTSNPEATPSPLEPGGIPAAGGAPSATIPGTGATLYIDVPEVAVPVVVRDKKGHALGGLSKTDFTVLDNGKPCDIVGFTVVKATASDEQKAGPSNPQVGASASPAGVPAPAQNRFVVFLFDDRHMDSSDLSNAQNAAIKMLDQPLADGEYADVLSFMGTNSGFTRDRAALQATIKKLAVHRSTQHSKDDCPDVDYFSADRIINKHDSEEFQIAVRKAMDCSGIQTFSPSSSPSSGIDNANSPYERMAASAASHALAVGEEDARMSLMSIDSVVKAMARLPGQRTLILVSPGFLAISPDAMGFKSLVFNQAAAASVVINALDARGLYVGNVSASEGGSGVAVSQMNGSLSQDRLSSMESSENVMAEMAEGTGGTFFHNNNDLQGGLQNLAAPPDYLYLLEISLKHARKNGAYHALRVKVNEPGTEVQARRGYVAAKPEKGKK
ncbi:MAG TPA: VWA domain-containing protein [Terracidiphilus sp.]